MSDCVFDFLTTWTRIITDIPRSLSVIQSRRRKAVIDVN